MNMNEEFWTKEDVYDNEISPLMKQIIEVCKEHKIPMVASFNYENHESKGEGKCTTLLFHKNEERKTPDCFFSSARALKNQGEYAAYAITTNPNPINT